MTAATLNPPNAIAPVAPPTHAYWRSMRFFNLYRLLVTSVFVASYFLLGGRLWGDNYNSALYLEFAFGYLVASLAALLFTWLQRPRFNLQLALHTAADVAFIVCLMYAAGGIRSGLGLLLIVVIAAASNVSSGRISLFYASLASIALLLEQSYQLITWDQHYDDYSHAVILCLSCFATAWLAHSFGKRTHQSEALASQRGIDLENLAQVNELITQEMQDGVLVVDRDFRLRHHNLQAEELLGINRQAWQGQALDDVAPELAALMQNWIEADSDGNPGVMRLTTEERELRLRFMPVGIDREHVAVIFIEDWSQMQTQAQQLKLAALGRLTANIAHEIRNPLSAISHANQLLQEDERDPAAQRMLQIIADNVQRMDQMVKEVLELNRRDRTQQENIRLEDFLHEFRDQFCQVEKVPAAGFGMQLGQQSSQISFDRRHLHQILWNVCRNGWRHSRQGSNSLFLRLQIAANGRSLRIEIADDGPGVAADQRAHLFEPFFTTEASGTGLGLYIARELCEANGASIKYANAVSGGLFSITISRQAPK